MENPSSKTLFLRALLIVSAVCWIFAPALRGEWLMDDLFYLPQNALLGDPARFWKIWFQPGSLIEYYPIEASLQAIQWRLWQNQTLGYHVTNLLLHLLGSFLVWRLLVRFGLRFAWLGGLLFAVHPVVVESVAYISEFKNVLSTPPFLLAMIAWIDYEEKGRRRDYALALMLFLVAMLCKISMALFPFLILLYAWWKRGRIGWRDGLAAAPLALVSLALGTTTILAGSWFREVHPIPPAQVPDIGLLSHLVLAGLSLAFYFTQCVLPVRLLPVYPMWAIAPTPLKFLPWAAVAGILLGLWTRRATWGRHALLGLGFFLINLAPFIGLTSVSFMGYTWVMDHLLYLPIIGLIGLAIAALEQFDERSSPPQRGILVAGTALVFALLAWKSHSYAEKFADQETLWTYTLERNPAAWLAHNNLGNVLLSKGQTADAIAQYEASLAIKPSNVETHHNLAIAYSLQGRTADAIAQFQEALLYDPRFALSHCYLADILARQGKTAEAIAHYRAAIKSDPSYTEAREHLAKLLAPSQP